MPPWRSQGSGKATRFVCLRGASRANRRRSGGTPRRASEAKPQPGGAPPTARPRQAAARGAEGGTATRTTPRAGVARGGGHTEPPRTPSQAPTPQAARGAGGRKRTPRRGAAHAPHRLKPRRRARSAPEHGAGGPTRTARAKPAAEGGGEAGPPERPPVYGGPSILGGRGADYDTPLPLGVHCSLFIEKTMHAKTFAVCGHIEHLFERVRDGKRTLDEGQASCYTGSRCQYYQYRHRDLCEVAHASPSSCMIS